MLAFWMDQIRPGEVGFSETGNHSTRQVLQKPQGKLACTDLIGKPRAKVVLAPFMITELVRGIVKGGERYFLQNRAMIGCMAQSEILERPKVFIFRILWNVLGGVSQVRPHHYSTLLGLLVGSNTLADFLKKPKQLAAPPRTSKFR